MNARVCRRAGWGWVLLLLAALICEGAAQPLEAVRFTTADGLPSNAVHQVVQDRHGYLWFATEDGLARFDGRHFRVWQREQGLAGTVLTRLALDAQDRLWIGTAQGAVMRLSADRTRIDPVVGVRGAAISALLADGDGVWFGVRGGGLYQWQAPHRLRHYLPTLRGDGVPAGDVEHLQPHPVGGVWVGTSGGLALWRDGRFRRPAAPGLATAAITGMAGDAAGTLWISTATGRWRSEGDSAVQIVAGAAGPRVLGMGADGAQWLADGGRVWRQAGDGSAVAEVGLAVVGREAPPHLQSVFEDRQGGAWLLGRYLGVWRLPPLWQHFRAQPAPARRQGVDGVIAAAGRIRAELACAGDQQWRLHGERLERRVAGGHWQRVRWPLAGSAAEHGAVSLHCMPEGGVWLGGRHGLLRWDGERLASVEGAPREISALHVAADGALWVAVPGALQRYAWHDQALRPGLRLDHRDGVPAGQLHAIATDAAGVVWATSGSGLLRIAPDRREVRAYSRDDGIPEAVLQAGLQAQGTQMLAIGRNRATLAFAPDALERPASPPALVIERVQLRRGGQRISVPVLPPLRLHADDRDIQITARVLSAQLDPRQQYRFRLRDGAQRWSHTRSRGTIGFPQLAPGAHVLQYQQRGGDGHWSAVQELPLQVQRTGWQHPLVHLLRALALIGVCGVAGWLCRRALAQARRRRTALQRRRWAEQSAQAKARYLATFGHELRTPLTGVLGMSELLLADVQDRVQAQRLRRIQEAARALLGIVDQALDDARIQAGRLPLQSARVDLLAVLQGWQRWACEALPVQGSGLTLQAHLPGQRWVQADSHRLRQLLESALQAVVEAWRSGPLIARVAWLPGRAGILLEILAPVRAVARSAGVVSGAALVRAQACARAQHGHLWLHAVPGGGGRLVLSLPLAAADADDRADRVDTGPTGGGACEGRVLLVEDDPLVAEVHAGLLAARGVQVVVAAHALAALSELATADVDMLLLDLDLPGMDGWQLLQVLQAQHCQVPVVVLTARADPDLAERVATAGAVGLLHKPAAGDALHAVVRQALRR